MSNPDPRAFEEKLLTIDLIDGLRREQERLDLALTDADRMKALRTEIQGYYAQAGITVSDALIDKAIAERQQQRFAFKPAKLGLSGRFIAGCYIYRTRLAAGVGTVALFSLFLWLGQRQVAQWQQQGELDDYRTALEQHLRDIDAVEARIASLPAQLPTVTSDVIPALPAWMSDLSASYQQSRNTLANWQQCQQLSLPDELPLAWSGEAQLSTCHAQLPEIEQAQARAQQTLNEQRQLASAVTNYVLLEQRLAANPTLIEWTAVSAPHSTAELAAQGGSRQQFIEAAASASTAVDSLSTLASSHAQASSCLSTAIPKATGPDSARLNGIMNEGQALKQNTSINGIADWTTRATDTCQFFSTPLSLRIVNERGADTGVWRYYDGNQGARTYYIIVDALTAGGGNANALIESVEDQRGYNQHRFGVRVSERTFDSIRQDKQDDGLLRDNTIGEKPANTFAWQLDNGFDPSFIAEW